MAGRPAVNRGASTHCYAAGIRIDRSGLDFRCFGNRVAGLDLNQPIDDGTMDAIWDMLSQHHIISIPGQNLSPSAVVDFSAKLGPLEPHVMDQYRHPDTPLIVASISRSGLPAK